MKAFRGLSLTSEAPRSLNISLTYILIDAVFIWTLICTFEVSVTCGVGTGGVNRTWPGTMKGKTEARFEEEVADVVGGAEAGGKRPRALSAVMSGFSGLKVTVGCDATLLCACGKIL